jgi:D-hexose-6-phosphate mutarotase
MMSAEIQLQSLNERFSIPGTLRFQAGNGGLIRAVCTTPGAEAHVYLHGAHVTHYQRKGEKPLIFMSAKSHFEPGKPIRGGVPICFPWFGPKKDNAMAPAHGFARLNEWSVESTKKSADGGVQITFSIYSDDSTRHFWPHDFQAHYTVSVGANLHLKLEVRNIGSMPMVFEEALHTYFSIADIRQALVEGLGGVDYLDKVQGGKRMSQGIDPLAFTGETDRVYLNTHSTCNAHDRAGGRTISVVKNGSNTTVIWNPWIAKAKAMADFGDDEWPNMLCIETCNVADFAVHLPSGISHTMEAIIT